MKEYDIQQKLLILTFRDLYQMGWDGNDMKVSGIVKDAVPYGFEIDSMKFQNKVLRVNLIRYDLACDFNIDNGVTEVPCPVCEGYGKYEVYTSHSFDQDCESCNGTGKKHIDEVC